jgi:hypothetical protein
MPSLQERLRARQVPRQTLMRVAGPGWKVCAGRAPSSPQFIPKKLTTARSRLVAGLRLLAAERTDRFQQKKLTGSMRWTVGAVLSGMLHRIRPDSPEQSDVYAVPLDFQNRAKRVVSQNYCFQKMVFRCSECGSECLPD